MPRERSILDSFFSKHRRRFVRSTPREVIVSRFPARRVQSILSDAPELGSVRALRRALEEADLRMRVMGTVRPAQIGPKSAGRSKRQATVSFDKVQRVLPGLSPWLENLGRELGSEGPAFTANAYVTASNAQGVSWHWDDHDVFVIHLAGKKRWELARGPVKVPLASYNPNAPVFDSALCSQFPSGIPATPDDPLKVEMAPGTALFVPAGTFHRTSVAKEGSISITIARGAPSMSEVVLGWLHGRLATDEVLCRPHFRTTAATIEQVAARLREAADEIDELSSVLGGILSAPRQMLNDIGPVYRRDQAVSARLAKDAKTRSSVLHLTRGKRRVLNLMLGSDLDAAMTALGSWLEPLERPFLLNELAVRAGLKSSTAYQLAATFAECGYIVPSARAARRAARGGLSDAR